MDKYLSDLNKRNHNALRNYIRLVSDYDIYRDLPFPERINRVALSVTNIPALYINGGRVLFDSLSDEPVTASYWHRKYQGNKPPGFECAGFMEMLLLTLRLVSGDIFDQNPRDLREVPRDTKFYKEAAGKKQGYKVSWDPRGGSSVIKDAGISEAGWPQTVHLLFFRREFEPVYDGMNPQIGNLVFFMNRGTDKQYHFHVGLWGYRTIDGGHRIEGLIHSSPSNPWDKEDGPKFTQFDRSYYRDFLEPQRGMWAEWFGTSLTRLKA